MIVFMAGERRRASPGANFLFHDTVFNPAGGAPLRYDDLLGHAGAIDHNDKWSHQLIADNLYRPVEDLAEWFYLHTTPPTDSPLPTSTLPHHHPQLSPSI